jgi:NADPH-dependent ferric siderophore reductase
MLLLPGLSGQDEMRVAVKKKKVSVNCFRRRQETSSPNVSRHKVQGRQQKGRNTRAQDDQKVNLIFSSMKKEGSLL